MNTTHQAISIESKEGKSFLRKVARSTGLPWREEWSLYASEETEWHVVFRRTIPGEIGEPDQYVEVSTDSVVTFSGENGRVKVFDDADEVVIPECSRVSLDGQDCRTAAKFLADGKWRLVVVHSGGSTSSSKHGLSFIYLQLERRNPDSWDILSIGSHSVLVNGVHVVRGAAE